MYEDAGARGCRSGFSRGRLSRDRLRQRPFPHQSSQKPLKPLRVVGTLALLLLSVGALAQTPDIETLPESEYVDTQRCLNALAYQSVEVLDEQRLVFKGLRGKIWLNQLKGRCPGLRRRMALEFTGRENRICELDGVRGLDQVNLRPMSARCMLGAFELITEQQLELLENILETR